MFPLLPFAGIEIVVDSFKLSDLFGKGIVFVLALCSIWAWTIIINKWSALRNIRKADAKFSRAFAAQKHPLELYAAHQAHPAAPPFANSAIWAAYLEACRTAEREFRARARLAGRDDGIIDLEREKLSPTQIESIRRAAECASADQVTLLEDSMAILGTIYTISPMMGLFGTVWGVMVAFYAMGLNGAANLQSLAPGMSSAMFTTFIGLIVAIPSAIGTNILTAHIRFISIQLENFPEKLAGALQRAYLAD